MFSLFQSKRRQKIALGFFAFLFVFDVVFRPIPAFAQAPVAVVADAPATAFEIKKTIGTVIYSSALGALVQGASYFMRKIAYDTAVAIATSGKGQSPLIFRNPGKYVQDVASDSVGTAIEELGKPFGLNLCQVPDLRVQAYLQIGLRSLYDPLGIDGPNGPRKPKCNWQSFKNNWKNAGKLYSGDELLSRFNADVRVEESDFGIALGAIARLDRIEATSQATANLEQLLGQGYKAVTGLITGNVKTPSQVIKEETNALTSKSQSELTLDQINGIYGAGAAQILPMAGSVFLNTLTSQLLDRALKRGLFADRPDPRSGARGTADDEFFSSSLVDNRRAAEQAFSFLFTAVPTKSLNAYNVIAEYRACPDKPGLNNCVIDDDMQRLIELGRTGKPLTIRQAIDQGYLDGKKPLISPRRQFDHTNLKYCAEDAYCYSNIQKLRKLRILPLGFEIAALKSDPDNPWTLDQVVKGFDSCARDAQGNPITDPKNPFCRLIDPNWIVKAVDARCEAKVFGPQRADTASPLRNEECVDISTCILEGPNGECLDTYGYCTKEKNVWRLGGQSCSAQFATCKTYVKDGTGEVVSYLARTLDTESCTAEDIGCRAYSTEKVGDAWTTSATVSKAYQRVGRNQTVYLNSAVDIQSCSAKGEGCTAFYPALRTATGFRKQTGAQPLYLKKAPDYLGCYDTNRATPATDWPRTMADILNALPKDERCDAFAQVCLPEETACDGFTPANGGPEIPAIVGGNTCSSQCVGYDAFRQEATAFEETQYPLYFVPSESQECREEFVGCDEFTNLEATAQGGERLEYYSQIKYCEKPNGTNERVYYSWEGDQNQGYTLKVHRLLQIDTDREAAYISGLNVAYLPEDDASKVFPKGSPAYAALLQNEYQQLYAQCNKSVYDHLLQTGEGNLNCRAFYDDAGVIYYRLIDKTVTVSNECRRLRKSEATSAPAGALDSTLRTPEGCSENGGNWNGSSCLVCSNGGHYENGVCVYQAIPNESRSCPAQANGCRKYVGNRGNNIRDIFQDEFESPTQTDWRSGTIVAEATQVGLHSLQVNTRDAIRNISAQELETNALYELSFWARGSNTRLKIYFTDASGQNQYGEFTIDENGNPAQVTLNANWREYRLGTVQFTGRSDEQILLHVERVGGDAYFLDNVRLRRVADTAYLLKKSLTTPAACDATPNDGLPGAALGCSLYTNRAGKPVTATGFDTLCRPQAIGCAPLYDSYNTIRGNDAALAQAHNVWCGKEGEGECALTLGTSRYTCQVGKGETGCYIPKISVSDINLLPDANITNSTVIIPADTPSSTPVYLTVRREFACDDREKGCQKVGLEEQILPNTASTSYRHSDAYVLNDPDLYQDGGQSRGILCEAGSLGCASYKNGNTTVYFRDPAKIGNKLCEYKEATQGSGEFGWFMKDVGRCSNDANRICKGATDCASGGQCQGVGTVACYADNIIQGGERGIWSNKTDKYQGFVGVCTEQNNLCTELVDVQDVSPSHPNGQPYYVIFDDRVLGRPNDCEGVSLKEGCVLFDKTDNPQKIYNAQATYEASRKKNDGFVAPEANIGPKNTNLVLKVDRDRACSEWLACRSSIPFTNEDGSQTNLCYEYKACEGATQGVACTDWVDQADVQNPFNTRLTETKYIQRNTNWDGFDYSGYSLYNKTPIENMVYVSFNLGTQSANIQKQFGNTTYIAYQMDDRFFASSTSGVNYLDKSCFRIQNGNANRKPDWSTCGFDDGGRCYNAKCLYPIGGRFPDGVNGTPEGISLGLQTLEGGTCKSYPEQDSPYPLDFVKKTVSTKRLSANPSDTAYSIARTDITQFQPAFTGVNYCQDGNCSCEYTKVIYKNDVSPDYWSTQARHIPQGICRGGTLDGTPCNPDEFANQTSKCTAGGGVCNGIKEKQTHVGVQGYCLEYDRSRPLNPEGTEFACLTWLPIDASVSGVDVYNTDISAGYNPAIDGMNGYGEVYCANATVGGPTDTKMFGPQSVIEWDDFNSSPQGTIFFEHFFPANDSFLPYTGYYDCARNFKFSRPGEGGGKFALVACDNERKEDFYKVMQTWAWTMIGSSATILRLESNAINAKPDRTLESLFREGHEYSDYYGFVPQQRRHDTPADAKLTFVHLASTPPPGQIETGVIMHPPRDWSIADDSSRSLQYEYLSQTRNTAGSLDTKTISTVYLSPGRKMEDRTYPLPREGEFVARSIHEDTLKDDSVDKVYFVPTMFTWSTEGVLPDLLTRELYIDIHTLRSKLLAGVNGEETEKKEITTAIRSDQNNNSYAFASSADWDESAWHLPFAQAALWQYVVKRDQVPGNLLKYWTYDGSTGNISGNDERNKIDHRYVLVFAGKGKLSGQYPNFINTHGLPTTPEEDPFLTECKSNNNGGADNWLAIGMDFNSNGEFLGYISRWCNGTDNDGREDGGMQLAVIATYAPQCTEFVQVHDDSNPLSAQANKAWTDRVWRQAKDVWRGLSDRWKEFNIQHQDPQQPFGSLRLKGNEVKVAEGNNLGNLRNYRFWNSSVDGKAYAYTDELTPGMKSITPESDRLAYNALSELFAKYFHIVDIGVNPSNVNATNPRHYPTVNDPTTFSTLNRSFPNPLPLDTANVTQAGRTTLRAPQVYSINPIRCQNQNDPNEIRSNAHEVCTVGERNNITVSDRNSVRSDYNGDGRIDEDTDGDGQVDPIVETGSYTAVVKFFAYADDNRMPIRRVMVDWNDGSMISNEGKKGLYKNRKPYCESSDDPSVKADTGYKYTGDLSLCINTTTNLPTGLTCKKQGDCGQGERCDLLNPGEGLCMTVPGAFDPLAYTSERCTRDSDCSNGGKCRIEEKDVYARVGRTDEYQIARFGDLPRACMPNYFQFVHSYTCGVYELEKSGVAVRSLNPIAKSKVNGLGYADDQKVCVFKPRVQVMDNWEWCNGNCGPNGCYKSQCDPADTEFDPWVYYGGQIIVLPFNRR